MGTNYDMKDEHKIRRLHSAIAQEKWTYFGLCKLPVVYSYEDMVSILSKSITDLSTFDRPRKKPKPSASQPVSTEPAKKQISNSWTYDATKLTPSPLMRYSAGTPSRKASTHASTVVKKFSY